MDNDNEVIHQQVMMFLGDELERIHKNARKDSYDIEKEYEKTKKNYSGFSIILLVSSILIIVGVAFIMTRVITSRNQEIVVSLQDFEDINLKNLLNSVSAAQSNYDGALKAIARTDTEFNIALKEVEAERENEIFVLDSMHLDSQNEYNGRLKLINEKYEEKLQKLNEEYEAKRAAAEEDAEIFRLALTKFDASAIESAKDSNSMDSESQLHKLELKSQEDKYEKRIEELETALQEQRIKNQEEMRIAINRLVEKYQARIDELDPKLSDIKAKKIITSDEVLNQSDFNGSAALEKNEISEKRFVDAVEEYQNKYNQFKYLDDVVADIPQKNSIPEYVSAARSLVNSMSSSYMDTTLSYYEEKKVLNQQIEENKASFASRQLSYEEVMKNMLAGLKSSAAILSASSYEDIYVYIVPQARYLISEEGAPAEFKVDKQTVKGSIFSAEADELTGNVRYRFVVAPDKDGNLPEIDFSLILPGQTIKILSK